MTRVCIVSTGTANLASVAAALRRLGAQPVLVTRARDVRAADRLVLPGVGAFGTAASALTADGLGDAVRDHVTNGKPFLAICLGLQLLAEGSAESPGTAGLGVIAGTATRLPVSVRVPQLGWNHVGWPDSMGTDGYAYFAHSYCIGDPPAGWRCATSSHGAPFIAAIERQAQLACQFHPELSGPYGAQLLQRWWSAC